MRVLATTLFFLALSLCLSQIWNVSARPLVVFNSKDEELQDARKELEALKKKSEKKQIPPIQFELGNAALREESKQTLALIADMLLRHPRLKLMVLGHTCDLGGDEYNLKLSQRRAEAVKTYLMKRGVPGESIRAKGFGKTRPRVPNDSEESRALNRRVEFVLMTRGWESIY